MLQVRAAVPTVQLEGADGPLTKNLPNEDVINLLLMALFFFISFNKNFSKGSEIVEISNINRRFSFGTKKRQPSPMEYCFYTVVTKSAILPHRGKKKTTS